LRDVQVLFKGGEAADSLYFIRAGVVELQVQCPQMYHDASHADARFSTCAPLPALYPLLQVPAPSSHDGRLRPARLLKVSDGGSFGELGFFLRRPQVRGKTCYGLCL
jgi:hypothetical protein